MENSLQSETLFQLDGEELALVETRYLGKNQLGFAVMLKFFQLEGRYPAHQDVIPINMISSLANQLGLQSKELEEFNWKEATAKRFRKEIRSFFGYRKSTLLDSKALKAWLMEHILPQAPTLPQCYEKAYQFFRSNKLVPFSSKELDRYISSAAYTFEQQFFRKIFSQLSNEAKDSIDNLLKEDRCDKEDSNRENQIKTLSEIKLRHLKKDIAGTKLNQVSFEIDKLKRLRMAHIPVSIFETVSRKLVQKYYHRILAELPNSIKKHSPEISYATMAMFCYTRSQLLTDGLADLLLHLIHKMKTSAETAINKQIIAEVKRVEGKFDILYMLADTAAENPTGIIKDEIYPKVSQEKLHDLVKELQYKGPWYQSKVQAKMRSLYSHAHRQVLLTLLDSFTFRTNNPSTKELLEAIVLIKANRDCGGERYLDSQGIPLKGVIPNNWYSMVIEEKNLPSDTYSAPKEKHFKINRLNYEIAVLEELHSQLRCKSIWIEGAYRYRNPDEDLPKNFEQHREEYYSLLNLPLNPDDFLQDLKDNLHKNLQNLNDSILNNKKVKIIEKKKEGRIKISPSTPQAEPIGLLALQRTISNHWPTISLLDILKEADLRIGFNQHFRTAASRENINEKVLHKRLLLCLYAIGSNTGLKRVSAANAETSYSDLRYIKRWFISVANVRAAIAQTVNEILAIRNPHIWGIATTGCACDSTKVSSWDQNLMTEWHVRYQGRGVMIYWHVDRKSACIYSQLKTCSSSEVGSMINGILKHSTDMDVKQSYVDSHGQSTIGFAFSHLLHFDLLPRLKNINRQKLYYPAAKHKLSYDNLRSILKASINWKLIKENYDEIIKHVAALKIGIVEPEVLIKRFSKDNYEHPVYRALTEIGKAIKTIFLCRYLSSEELRIEIHDALNVVERLNSIMSFIFYGKLGEISTNNKEDQELSVVCLHLLQVCMVYINTLLIQEVLSQPEWRNRLTHEDKRALTPLIHAHINPYGLFPLDLDQRLMLAISKTIQWKKAA